MNDNAHSVWAGKKFDKQFTTFNSKLSTVFKSRPKTRVTNNMRTLQRAS